jgi:AMMECR1 domain-containing protein
MRRATFLPQVWEKVSEPSTFLDMLCEKMGFDYDLWRRQKLDVFTYQVESFNDE